MGNLDNNGVSADRLTFGLKLVVSMLTGTIAICLFIVGLGFGVKTEISDLRSDVRVMRTQGEDRGKLEDERSKSLSESVANLQRLLQLQAYEVNALKFSLSQAGIRIKYPKE